MERIAVIDVGTNSVRVLFAELNSNDIVNRKKEIITTRLGEKLSDTNKITKRAINDTFKAIETFNKKIIDDNYRLFKVIATSALRDASNSDVLVNKVKSELGIEIDIISGEQEAEYGYFGVSNSFDRDSEKLIIDIGGGSTELISGRETIDKLKSLDVGAVRMTDMCINSDPINKYDEINLNSEINNVLNTYIDVLDKTNIDKVIGIGGTITTLAAIKNGLKEYLPDVVHMSSVTIDELDTMIYKFKKLPLKERKKIDGLDPSRADIILAGTLILRNILNMINFDKIYISDYDNLEGIIFKDFIK